MGNLISFFKKVADGLRAEGNFGTAHVYRSTLNIVTTFHGSRYLDFHQVNPEWLKDFEVYLRSRGSSWNTVSTYLRVLRAVYNRAVDLRKAEYIPHLFRSVYTGTRETGSVRWKMKICEKFLVVCRNHPQFLQIYVVRRNCLF